MRNVPDRIFTHAETTVLANGLKSAVTAEKIPVVKLRLPSYTAAYQTQGIKITDGFKVSKSQKSEIWTGRNRRHFQSFIIHSLSVWVNCSLTFVFFHDYKIPQKNNAIHRLCTVIKLCPKPKCKYKFSKPKKHL